MKLPSLFAIFPQLTPAQAGAVAFGVFLGVILLDVYARKDGIEGNTPREILIRWSRAAPSILGLFYLSGAGLAFLLGGLVGHWFHPGNTALLGGGWLGLGVVVGAAAVWAIVAGAVWKKAGAPPKALTLTALVGALVAALFWPVGG